MRRVLLVFILALYNIFMPFVLLNCGAVDDTPYVRGDDGASAEPTLDECEAREFLTEDCVAVIQAAAESETDRDETITTAFESLSDFENCRAYTGEAVEGDDTDCADVSADVVAGSEVCAELAPADKGLDCLEIEEAIGAAGELCGTGDASVAAAFCALIA